MTIKNVALIGGTGTLGAPILEALKASQFNVFVLNRASSKSSYSDVTVITIPDDLGVEPLAKALEDNRIDALVLAIKGSYVDQQRLIIDAAFKGGVKRVIPAEFGSCDSADEKTNEILPLMNGKKGVRDYLISLQSKERKGDRGNLAWTALVSGHFFDYGLGTSLLKFDVKGRKAYILDGGDIKFSASNLSFIANAVIKILEKSSDIENKLLYINGHYVTQNEITAMLEKVTGEKFERIQQNSEVELSKERPKMLAGDADAQEEVVAIWGIVAADWKSRDTFANELLGLQEEDLEASIRKVVEHL